MSNPSPANALKKSFGLYDVVCIIVGIIIAAPFINPSNIAGMLPSAGAILLVWLLGGVLSFIGALCYAELASTHPKEGGDYFFLHHAFGDWAGFLYAWDACGSFIPATSPRWPISQASTPQKSIPFLTPRLYTPSLP
jgi:amino acid transporter